MKLEIKADYVGIGQIKPVGEHTITKFYVEADKDTDYPVKVEFQFFNDKIDLSSMKPNDKLTVHFNIKSRVWESPDKGKIFFQHLDAWKIVVDTPTAAAAPVKADPLAESQRQLPDSQSDKLPF